MKIIIESSTGAESTEEERKEKIGGWGGESGGDERKGEGREGYRRERQITLPSQNESLNES